MVFSSSIRYLELQVPVPEEMAARQNCKLRPSEQLPSVCGTPSKSQQKRSVHELECKSDRKSEPPHHPQPNAQSFRGKCIGCRIHLDAMETGVRRTRPRSTGLDARGGARLRFEPDRSNESCTHTKSESESYRAASARKRVLSLST